MERQYVNPADLATPPKNLYNHVVKVGKTVYIAGQVSRDRYGKTLHVGDIAAQVREVWLNLERAVSSVGGTLKDVVKTTTYLVGAENLPKVIEARRDILSPEGRPTSAMIVVAGLASPDLLVEVEAIAVID